MSSAVNSTQAAHGKLWGAKARDWANFQEGVVRPVYEAVLRAAGVKRGTIFLDVGCGSGMAAAMAGARGAVVSGLDAAAPMIEIARERMPGGDFRVGDIEALPYPGAAFDVVTGFNAFQFAADPKAALVEARRVTKRGGRVAIVTWGNPDGMQAAAVVGALRHLLPAPPPGTPGPFALSDEAALRNFAHAAGLTPTDMFDVSSPFEYPDEATAVRGLCSSGVATRAAEAAGEAAVARAYSQAIAPFRNKDGTVRIDASFRCLMTEA
jgi:SAM-dependent methyltransferase